MACDSTFTDFTKLNSLIIFNIITDVDMIVNFDHESAACDMRRYRVSLTKISFFLLHKVPYYIVITSSVIISCFSIIFISETNETLTYVAFLQAYVVYKYRNEREPLTSPSSGGTQNYSATSTILSINEGSPRNSSSASYQSVKPTRFGSRNKLKMTAQAVINGRRVRSSTARSASEKDAAFTSDSNMEAGIQVRVNIM